MSYLNQNINSNQLNNTTSSVNTYNNAFIDASLIKNQQSAPNRHQSNKQNQNGSDLGYGSNSALNTLTGSSIGKQLGQNHHLYNNSTQPSNILTNPSPIPLINGGSSTQKQILYSQIPPHLQNKGNAIQQNGVHNGVTPEIPMGNSYIPPNYLNQQPHYNPLISNTQPPPPQQHLNGPQPQIQTSNINHLIPKLQNVSLNGSINHVNNNIAWPTAPLSSNESTNQNTVGIKPPLRPSYPNQQSTFPPVQQHNQQYISQHEAQSYPQGQFNSSSLQYQNQPTTVQNGFNKLWGQPDVIDLMQTRHVLPPAGYTPPPITLNHQFLDSVNCSPNILRCTLNKIPQTNSLLQKSRLPLGILIHPFRDLTNLPVVSCSQIVRCRSCRTYINPFAQFVDSKKWKCNLCYRVNELPDEFQYDPVSKSYGDVTKRPEVRSSTIEFIAPSEYMLRPPQPAIYLFLLDVSMAATQCGYLSLLCDGLAEHLDKLPGDARTQIGFIAYNSYIHFYSIAEGYNRPHEITITDLDDMFLPRPDNLLINLKENRELINDLLDMLPKRFENSHDNGSALGAALQVGFKMMSLTGGRVTVFQTCLPNKGPGALQPREDPNKRSGKDINHLGPATDFYKRLALEYSEQQIAADLFLLNSQYSDLATLSGISKFSGGSIYHIPLFNMVKKEDCMIFRKTFERYITRKIGFEAVMRVRCTRGLQIHTFHGNFFVRSTDLLSLPNTNPDAGYGMQISYDESLTDIRTVCLQAALLYTSSNAERRIRVHTICFPVTNSLPEILNSADVQCIVGLLSKMGVDRAIQANLTDARDAFINASVDILSAVKVANNLPAVPGQLQAPSNLALLPAYILSLLKCIAFRTGTSTRLDDRIFGMCELKSLPLDQLMKYIYPDFYDLECIFMKTEIENKIQIPAKRHLSAEILSSRSMYVMDTGVRILIYIGSNIEPQLLKNVIGVDNINQIPDLCFDLQTLESLENKILRSFIDQLNEDKPYPAIVQIIRDSSTSRNVFIDRLVDDRTQSTLSYYEFLQHIKSQMK